MVSEQQKIGLIFAFILLIPTFLPAFYGFLIKPEKESFEIPLCKVSNEVTIDAAKQEKEKYLNVPDYDAKIFINISKQNYIVDDFAEVNVKIQDKGIIKLSKPYFYLLVFDPSDKLKEMFPCFINEKEKQFSGNIGTSYVYSPKWAQWVSPTIVLVGNQYSCADKESFYFSPNNCISISDLMNSTIITTPIRYTFKITEPGAWKIFVFLFDEEYKSRPNTRLLDEYGKGPVSFQNALAYGYSEFL